MSFFVIDPVDPLCRPAPALGSMRAALTQARSHDLIPTRWCDLFDVTSSPSEGWMLLDLPGAPCNVTQPQMRTMTQRLRKAQECAATGGKYGLLQAVLLSLDSQPYCPAHWLRQCVALEACSKVLLPAAHEAQVDVAAARAAYQQLTPAEQRLWCQLQAARIQLKRSCNMATGNMDRYLPNLSLTANVLAGVSGDICQLGHEAMRRLMLGCLWGLCCRLIKRYCSVEDPATPPSMQAAHNWALAAYFHHGKDHPETKAALAATKAADPEAWVPKLMAGLSYPYPGMAPASMAGSKMEAVGYAHHFGALWATDAELQMQRMMDLRGDCFKAYSRPLKWLLKARDIPLPSKQVQGEVVHLRRLTCGDLYEAHGCVCHQVLHVLKVVNSVPWPLSLPQIESLGVARVVRMLVAHVLAAAVLTSNLPPISAAPQLWLGLGLRLQINSLPDVAAHFKTLGTVTAQTTMSLIHAYCIRPVLEGTAAAAGQRAGFWGPAEQDELGRHLLSFLDVAAVRWVWQCGDAKQAKEMSEDPLRLLREKVYTAGREVVVEAADGEVPGSVEPLKTLAAFLAQEAARQRPRVGLQLVQDAFDVAERGQAAAAVGMLAAAGDPQDQALYGQFPGWLDQLLSQVTGRGVSLVIEPKAAFSLMLEEQMVTGMYLRETATGSKQLFGWRHPGDVDYIATYNGMMQAARQRGCHDRDLLEYAAAVEPYQSPPAAGSSSSSSSSARSASSSSPRLPDRRPQPSQEQGAAAAGGGSAATPAAASRRGASTTSAVQQQEAVGITLSSKAKPSKACAQCGELFPKLKLCTRCRSVSYCSKDCQLRHWKAGHKQVCKEQPAE